MKSLPRIIVIAGILVLGTVGPCLLYGDEPVKDNEAAKEKQKINLNDEEVDVCIKVLPDFLAKFPSFNPLTGAGSQASGPPNVKTLISAANINKLNEFAAANGYKDFNDFARHFSGVMSGYMYYKTQSVVKMFEEQSSTLPPETAALMKAQMKPVEISLKKLEENVTPELLKAVKPHVAELDKIMGLQ